MSAPGITYSGVLAERGPNGRNDVNREKDGVFQGLKFWLSSYVPQRPACMNTIMKNGGVITARERDADLLICNPKRSPVSGSYSHELIEDAVRACSLDAKDDYLCTAAPIRPGAPAGTSTKPKVTRNRFTRPEDDLLTDYVREMEKLGEPISGNEIYKSFADNHPSHTWQAWRDRWVKSLQFRSSSSSLPPPVESRPQGERASVALGQTPASGTKENPASRTKERWTSEEDEIILNAIQQAIRSQEPWDGSPPYERLAREFPQRTQHAWRQRALYHVSKQNRERINQWQAEAESQLSDVEDNDVPTVRDADGEGNNAEIQVAPPQDEHNTDQREEPAVDSIAENRDEADRAEPSPVNHVIGSTKTPPSTKPLRQETASQWAADSDPIIPGSAEVEMREQFYRDYNTFLSAAAEPPMPAIPSVGGKAIGLWDLWKSVTSKKVDPVELDWQQVAEDLDLDWVAHESVPEELRQCYERYLATYAEYMMGFDPNADETTSTESDLALDAERALPSSPPLRPSLKRAREEAETVFEQGPRQRRMLSREDEIPSTPERHSRTLRFRSQELDMSPTQNRRQVQQWAGSPSSRSQASPYVTGALPVQGQGRQVEPETQDFAFDLNPELDNVNVISDDAEDDAEDDSERTVTPSQQLHVESLEMSQRRQAENTPSPTPTRRFKVPPQDENSDGDLPQSARSAAKVVQAPRTTPVKTQPTRRTLPASFVPTSRRVNTIPATSSPGIPPTSHQQQQSSPSSRIPETQPRRPPVQQPPRTRKETPEDVIDRFVSLGYARDVVMRSLRATTWHLGNAGQVMEMLKRGEPLPQRTSGVWTQRDDDSLALVYSSSSSSSLENENVNGGKEGVERRKDKELRRLLRKHGEEQIALRKRYLFDEV
ncbi:hypothetical protein F5Y17DRAFT_450446 [Xylariaceae sp. FL0594]|nr:hypothetical protein F5Y17DRAFT_450446 [Xylariaceae sp. FL0594]